VDKQASAMLDLVRSCGLVFTAAITWMLSKMMRGQVTALTTILAMNTARRLGEILAGFRGKEEGKPTLTGEGGVECSEVHLCSVLGAVKMVDFGRCLRFASSIGLNRLFRFLDLK